MKIITAITATKTKKETTNIKIIMTNEIMT